MLTNQCPITLELLTIENAFLIKVHKLTDDQKDIYYYIGNEETLKQLNSCPFTRRQGYYYSLKLSSGTPTVAHKLLSANSTTLIEDNDALTKIDMANKFNWQLREFKNQVIDLEPMLLGPLVPLRRERLEAIFRIPPPRVLSRNHQVISDYKANFLRDILPLPWEYRAVANNLIRDSLSGNYDLLFLIKSQIHISAFRESGYKTHLKNAYHAQLIRYAAGLLMFTNTVSFIVYEYNKGFSLGFAFHIFKMLLMEHALDNLERLFREGRRFNFNKLVTDSITQLVDPIQFFPSVKKVALGSYQFLRTNLSFFHNKFTRSEPVHYELPDDLENSYPEYLDRGRRQ